MSETTEVRAAVPGRIQQEADKYQGDNDQPLGGYVVVLCVYGLLVAATTLIALATGRKLPERWHWQDLLTLSIGTHKLSRTISKDAVTSPLRAPFTKYQDTGGPAELIEEPREESALRHSLGELLTCPFCLDMWVATGFVIGLVFAPRFTRLIAGTFTALAGADFLQLAYAQAQQAAEG